MDNANTNEGLLEQLLDIDGDQVHEFELECFSVTATLRTDFGPWKKGHKGIFTLNVLEGWLREYDDDGRTLREVKLRLELRGTELPTRSSMRHPLDMD